MVLNGYLLFPPHSSPPYKGNTEEENNGYVVVKRNIYGAGNRTGVRGGAQVAVADPLPLPLQYA
jgi:hypothetical protein